MKQKNIFFLGILSIILIFGVLLIACGADGTGPDPALNGTWINDEYGVEQYTFNNGFFEANMIILNKAYDPPVVVSIFSKGTYTTSNGQISTTMTHIHGDWDGFHGQLESKWYTKEEVAAAWYALLISLGEVVTEEEVYEDIGKWFALSQTASYSVIGDTLIISGLDSEGKPYTETYTRK